jgi:hypothetical protein
MRILYFILSILFFNTGFSQNNNAGLKQKLKGIVVDADSRKPLQGVSINLSTIAVSAISNENGVFIFNDVPVGRHALEITLVGYESKSIPEVILTSGKELELNISLNEKISQLNDVLVSATKNKAKALNEFATASARSFTIEDAKRYPSSLSDPARMAQNFAGVSPGVGDGSNDVSVRGNSPGGVLWRLEGVQIPGPNHYSSLGQSGGAISMLSSSTLGSSDFYSGAFPAEFGNANSGIFDLTFRNGNKDKREYSFQAGFLGIELAAEGPFKKSGNSSYLINYRYSTTGLINSFLNLGTLAPIYQDISFKLHFSTKSAGTFDIFGLGGINNIKSNPVKDSTKWVDTFEGNLVNNNGKLGVIGISHQYFLNAHVYIKTILSANAVTREENADSLIPSKNYSPGFIAKSNYKDFTYVASVLYNNKINAKSTIRVGAIVSNLTFDYKGLFYNQQSRSNEELLNFNGSSLYYQGYAQWKQRLTDRLTMNAGLHATYLAFNKTGSIEPRLAFSYNAGNAQTFSFAAGLHAKPLALNQYLFENVPPGGARTTPNKNLEMIKALHFVLGYEKGFTNGIRFKAEAYYQHLYDVPVEQSATSGFSILNTTFINELAEIGTMVNKGTARNYGIDLNLEKSFTKNYYFLSTFSLYSSTYKDFSNREWNTTYNRKYQLNVVGGKEWKGSRNANRTWGVSVKLLTSGGLRLTPIDLVQSRIAGRRIDVPNLFFTENGDNYFRFDLGLSYKVNRKKSTHRLSLDIQNVTNNQNVEFSFYDAKFAKIVKLNGFGFVPTLNYRIEF